MPDHKYEASIIPFSDLYIRVDDEEPARWKPKAKGRDERGRELPPLGVVPAKYQSWLDGLRSELLAREGVGKFSITFDNIRYRVAQEKTFIGGTYASLRKIEKNPPNMRSLKIPEYIQNRFKFMARSSGIIAVTGATGEGKSSSATAALCYYLETFGDVAFTIEDPVEYNLQERDWGKKAKCFQFEIPNNDETKWDEYIKTAMRFHPRYIFLGELRTTQAAASALKAAKSGHLVLTTLHGGSIQEGLGALRAMAEPEFGKRVDQMIADSFLMMTHQRLRPTGVDMQVLHSESVTMGDSIRSQIRDGKYEMLSTKIESQNSESAKKRVLQIPKFT